MFCIEELADCLFVIAINGQAIHGIGRYGDYPVVF